MEFESLDAAIKFAIEKEQEAVEFYTTASGEAVMSGVKQMLRDFAKEEVKHKQMLANLDPGIISTYKSKSVANLKRSDYLQEMKFEKNMTFRDIITIAMKREEKAVKLYKDLEKLTAKTPDLVSLFKMLQEEEAKHKLALETMYDDHMAEAGD